MWFRIYFYDESVCRQICMAGLWIDRWMITRQSFELSVIFSYPWSWTSLMGISSIFHMAVDTPPHQQSICSSHLMRWAINYQCYHPFTKISTAFNYTSSHPLDDINFFTHKQNWESGLGFGSSPKNNCSSSPSSSSENQTQFCSDCR